jgi:type II secretory pathway component PulM
MQRQGKLLEIAVKRDWQDLNPRARKILTGLLYIVTIAD